MGFNSGFKGLTVLHTVSASYSDASWWTKKWYFAHLFQLPDFPLPTCEDLL